MCRNQFIFIIFHQLEFFCTFNRVVCICKVYWFSGVPSTLFNKQIFQANGERFRKWIDFYALIPPRNIIVKLGYSLESLWSGDMSRCKCHHETWKAVFFDECTFLAHMEIVRVITFVRFQDKKIFLAAMNLVSIAFGPQIIGSQHLVPMNICCQSVNTTVEA